MKFPKYEYAQKIQNLPTVDQTSQISQIDENQETRITIMAENHTYTRSWNHRIFFEIKTLPPPRTATLSPRSRLKTPRVLCSNQTSLSFHTNLPTHTHTRTHTRTRSIFSSLIRFDQHSWAKAFIFPVRFTILARGRERERERERGEKER